MNRSILILTNQRGQAVMEYMIVASLIAIGAIGGLRFISKQMNHKMAQISDVLRGDEARENSSESMSRDDLRRKDLGNFFKGAASRSRDSQ